jgi:two-component system OmpR family response regulator
VRALVRREPRQRSAVLRVGDLLLDPAERKVRRGDTPIALSAPATASTRKPDLG